MHTPSLWTVVRGSLPTPHAARLMMKQFSRRMSFLSQVMKQDIPRDPLQQVCLKQAAKGWGMGGPGGPHRTSWRWDHCTTRFLEHHPRGDWPGGGCC